MPLDNKTQQIYTTLKGGGADVGTEQEFNDYFFAKGDQGYKNRLEVWRALKGGGADVGKNYEEFRDWLGLHATKPAAPRQSAAPAQPRQAAVAQERRQRQKQAFLNTPKTSARQQAAQTQQPAQPVNPFTPTPTFDTRPYYQRMDEDVAIEQGRQAQTSSNPENIHAQVAVARGQQAEAKKKARDMQRVGIKTPQGEVFDTPEEEARFAGAEANYDAVKDVQAGLYGDAEAAERSGLKAANERMREEQDYYDATGKELRLPVNLPGVAPTAVRDDDGQMLIGMTTDEHRVEQYQQQERERVRRELSKQIIDPVVSDAIEGVEGELDAKSREALVSAMNNRPLFSDDKVMSESERAAYQIATPENLLDVLNRRYGASLDPREENFGGSTGMASDFANRIVAQNRSAIEQGAARLGMSVEDFVAQEFIPQVSQRLAEGFIGHLEDKYSVKDVSDYLTRHMFNSVLGTVASMNDTSKIRRRMAAEQLAKSDSGDGKYYNAGVAAKIGGKVAMFAADAPILIATGAFGGAAARAVGGGIARLGEALGKEGMTAFGRLAASGSPFLAANVGKATKWGGLAMNRALGGTGLGMFMGTSSAIQDLSTGDGSLSSVGSAFLHGFGEGTATGALLGVTNLGAQTAAGNIAGNSMKARLGRAGLFGSAFVAENQLFANMDRFREGDFDWVDSTLDAFYMQLAGKVSSSHGIGESMKGVARLFSGKAYTDKGKTGLSWQSDGFRLSDEERGEIERAFGGTKLTDVAANPENVMKILSDKQAISWKTRQKVAGSMGMLEPSRPRTERILVMDKVIDERGDDYELIESHPFNTEEEKQDILQRIRDKRDYEDMLSDLAVLKSVRTGVSEESIQSAAADLLRENPTLRPEDVEEGGSSYDVVLDRARELDGSMATNVVRRFASDYNMTEKEVRDLIDKTPDEYEGDEADLAAELRTRLRDTNNTAEAVIMEAANDFGMRFSDVVDIMKKNPVERTEEEYAMMDNLARRLHEAAFPDDVLHESQSRLDGRKEAGEGGEITPENAQALAEKVKRAEDRLNAFLSSDKQGIGEDVRSMMNEQRRADEILMHISENYSGTEAEQAMKLVSEYYNAKAQREGFIEKVGENIDQSVQDEVTKMGFKGTIDDNPDTDNIITISHDGEEYILLNGALGTRESDGTRLIDPGKSGGMIIALDNDGQFVQFKPDARMQITGLESKEDYSNRRREELGVKNTKTLVETGVIPPEEKPAGKPADTVAGGKEQGGGRYKVNSDAISSATAQDYGKTRSINEDFYSEHPERVQEELTKDVEATARYMNGETSDREYLIELGYATGEKSWLDHATPEEIHKTAEENKSKFSAYITDSEAAQEPTAEGPAVPQQETKEEAQQPEEEQPTVEPAPEAGGIPLSKNGRTKLYHLVEPDVAIDDILQQPTSKFVKGNNDPNVVADRRIKSAEERLKGLDKKLKKRFDEQDFTNEEAEDLLALERGEAPKTEMGKYVQAMTEAQGEIDYYKKLKGVWQQRKIAEAEEARRKADEAAVTETQPVEEDTKRDERFKANREKFEQSKEDGDEDTIVLANGETIEGHYVLVEADAVTPSHNPRGNFAKSEGFPVDENGKTINDRDYENDKTAQNLVQKRSQAYDQRAVNTPVVVSEDGIVLSGNDRTMSGQLAADQGTDKAYVDYITKHAKKWGFTPEQVSGKKNPRIVFVPKDRMEYNAETFAKFNQDEKKSQNSLETAVKMGKVLASKPDTLRRIGAIIDQVENLSDLYSNNELTKELILAMKEGGLITDEHIERLMTNGLLSAQGKDEFETMLAGVVVDEDALRILNNPENGLGDLRRSIAFAAVPLVKNQTLGEYSIIRDLSEAVRLYHGAKGSKTIGKDGDITDYFINRDAFDGAPMDTHSLAQLMLANQMAKGGYHLKRVIEKYNEAAQPAANKELDWTVGGIRSKEDILTDILKQQGYDAESIRQRVERLRETQPPVGSNTGSGTGGEGKGDETKGKGGAEPEREPEQRIEEKTEGETDSEPKPAEGKPSGEPEGTVADSKEEYLKPRNDKEKEIISDVEKKLAEDIAEQQKKVNKAKKKWDDETAKVNQRPEAGLFGDEVEERPKKAGDQLEMFEGEEKPALDVSEENLRKQVKEYEDAYRHEQQELERLKSKAEHDSRVRGALDNERLQTEIPSGEPEGTGAPAETGPQPTEEPAKQHFVDNVDKAPKGIKWSEKTTDKGYTYKHVQLGVDGNDLYIRQSGTYANNPRGKEIIYKIKDYKSHSINDVLLDIIDQTDGAPPRHVEDALRKFYHDNDIKPDSILRPAFTDPVEKIEDTARNEVGKSYRYATENNVGKIEFISFDEKKRKVKYRLETYDRRGGGREHNKEGEMSMRDFGIAIRNWKKHDVSEEDYATRNQQLREEVKTGKKAPSWNPTEAIEEAAKEFKKEKDKEIGITHDETPEQKADRERAEKLADTPLTEDEVNGSSVSDVQKTLAKAYLKGNHGIAQTAAYLNVYNDVRNRRQDGAGDSLDAGSGTQLDSRENQPESRPGRTGGTTVPVDEAKGGSPDEGQLRVEDGKGQPDTPVGKRGDRGVSGAEPAVDGLPSGGKQPAGGGESGVAGSDVRGGKGHTGGSTDTKKPSAGSDAAISASKQRLAELRKKFKDAGRNGTTSISLAGMNSEQIEVLGEIITESANLGYQYLNKGLRTFNEWRKQMLSDFKDWLQEDFKWSDSEVDEYLQEVWNCEYDIDGVTRTIGEWASFIGEKELKKIVKADRNVKFEAQKAAESIEVKTGDIDNIRETLPYLLPEQQDDVLKAETQFFDEKHQDREHGNGKGYMFTNGTGTGKTYTGLGIVKRFVKQGKGRVLIITPSQEKVTDWANDGKNLGLDIEKLDDVAKATGTTATKSKGKGVVVTTYANARQNLALLEDCFDLIVYDESHKITEGKEAAEGEMYKFHQMLTNKDVERSMDRQTYWLPEWIEQRNLLKEADVARERLNELEGTDTDEAIEERNRLNARMVEIANRLDELRPVMQEIRESKREQAEKDSKHTKTVFLSATPFNSRENLKYAEGYIFSYPEEDPNTKGSYNHRSPEDAFLEQTFPGGYRWRYGRLEEHVSNAEALGRQEIDFSDYLQNQLGTMSGRMITSDYDYSRDFPVLTLDNAGRFNQAMSEVYRNKKYQPLADIMRKVWNYNDATSLFEAMKTSLVNERIKEHLARGQKVVVFHRRRTSRDIAYPFTRAMEAAREMAAVEQDKKTKEKLLQAVKDFEKDFQDIFAWEKTIDYTLPREQIERRFGKDKVAFFSGAETKNAKHKSVEEFMKDNGGKDIIVIQEASGKEGISLHDQTGEHQRVEINLALPQSPIAFIQIEGRIYRIGQKSNAIFEYPLLGLDLETNLFAQQFNNALGTTENLALGSNARNLRKSIATSVLENTGEVDYDRQGYGGKDMDGRVSGSGGKDGFDVAIDDYYGNQKMSRGRDNREGTDYFPTPEPIGYKMVEWAQMLDGETALEPSAGHGAIARYVPETNGMTAIEPSASLFTKLQMRAGGPGRKFEEMTFEDYPISNKHDAILMNPPYGVGGKTAMEHVAKAFRHLNEGGRIIAIIPDGPSMEKRFDAWLGSDDLKGAAVVTGEIRLPGVAFSRAGTSVNTRIVVIDKVSRAEMRKGMSSKVSVDLRNASTVDELFDQIRNVRMPERTIDNVAINTKKALRTKGQIEDNPFTRSYEIQGNYLRIKSRARYGDCDVSIDLSNPQREDILSRYRNIKNVMDDPSKLDYGRWDGRVFGKGKNAIPATDAIRDYCEKVIKTLENVSGMTADQMDRALREADEARQRRQQEEQERMERLRQERIEKGRIAIENLRKEFEGSEDLGYLTSLMTKAHGGSFGSYDAKEILRKRGVDWETGKKISTPKTVLRDSYREEMPLDLDVMERLMDIAETSIDGRRRDAAKRALEMSGIHSDTGEEKTNFDYSSHDKYYEKELRDFLKAAGGGYSYMETKQQRLEREAAEKAPAKAEATVAGYEYKLDKNTRTGADMHLVTMNNRLSDADYRAVERKAKANGGYYNRFKKAWHFTTEEDARKFMESVKDIPTQENSPTTRFSKRKKKTSETVVPRDRSPFKATVVSDADGAKVVKNLETFAQKSENLTIGQKNSFISDLAKVLRASKRGSNSQYAKFETVEGTEVLVRLADHNATVSNFDYAGEENGISIVISRRGNEGITNDGHAHIAEYFYSDKELKKADGNPYAQIVKSLQQALYSGEYKDTTGLAKKQEVNEPVTRFRKRESEERPVFVSNAHRAVENIKQEKATPEQWLKMIEKNGGLKAGEDKWMGLSEWLNQRKTAGHGGSITKQEVLDFIRENQIQVEEVNYSEAPSASYGRESLTVDEVPEAMRQPMTTLNDRFKELVQERRKDIPELWKARNEAYDTLLGEYGQDFADAFGVRGGELVVRNAGQLQNAGSLLGVDVVDKNINPTRLKYTTSGLHNKKEIALVVPTVESWNQSDDVHFGDAGEGRAVAWVRFGDAYIPNMGGDPNDLASGVSKVLVIDEIQSKRHQEGREKGYRETHSKEYWEDKVSAAKKEFEDYKERFKSIPKNELTEADADKYVQLQNALLEAEKRSRGEYFPDSRIPDAPFEKNWHELAMKRMLRYAAENGYDKVAWTKGEQQADRYNLGGKVDAIYIDHDKDDPTKYSITVYDKESMPINVLPHHATAEEISNVFGKELAKKLIDGVAENDKKKEAGEASRWDSFVLEGNGLRVGGEGMKGFYDQMLPRFMDKYGKKWGVKTGEVELPDVEEAGRKMWSVDVTPEMKKSVMEGQTMFRKGGEAQNPVEADFERKRKAGEKIAKNLNMGFEAVTDKSQITNREVLDAIAAGEEPTGWIEIDKDGKKKIYMYLPNIRDTYEAEKTIAHETVGHYGLRELLGEKGYKSYMRSLMFELRTPELSKYIEENLSKNNYDMYRTVDEFLADAAEKGYGDLSMWQKVRNYFTDALRKAGFDMTPSISDVKYMVWLSKHHLERRGDVKSKLQRESILWRLGQERYEAAVRNGEYVNESVRGSEPVHTNIPHFPGDAVRFRHTPSVKNQKLNYERALKRLGYVWKEAHVDQMQAAVELMRAISGVKKIEDIPAAENFVLLENQISSKEEQLDYLLNRDYMRPLDDAVAKCLPEMGSDIDEQLRNLQLYMIKKHGLERNRVLFVRDAIRELRNDSTADQKQVDDMEQDYIDTIRAARDDLKKGYITLREYHEEIDEWIRQNIDPKYKAGAKDYSGLTAMSGGKLDDSKFIDDVMGIEDMLGEERVNELWEKTKALSQFGLDMEYEGGLDSKAQHDKVSEMFEWYVPLRGYDEKVAEEVYDYLEEDGGNNRRWAGPVLMNAKGHDKYLSDVDVFATLGAMSSYAISRALRNQMKQSFARFVRNHYHGTDGLAPSERLVTELPYLWAEKQFDPKTGHEIWVETFPDIPEGAKADDVASIVEQYEADMKAKEQAGDAKRVRQNSSIPYRAAKREHKSQHIVDVWINGEKHSFVVNGNPRAAQAINGQLKSEGAKNPFSRFVRTMAQLNTSYSPDFIVGNTERDFIFASSAVGIKEGTRYLGRWWKNYFTSVLGREAAGVPGLHTNLFNRYRNGTLNMNNETDRYFKEFMENGGETGWVETKNLDKWKKEIRKGVKVQGTPAKVGSFVLNSIPKAIEAANERAENMARFATYLTSRQSGRSIVRSVSDAKEVSVNFNRKGAGKKTAHMNDGRSALQRMNAILAARTAQFGQDYYMFYNAGVQGLNNAMKLTRDHPWRASTVFAGFLAGGLLIPWLNQSLIADEDPKERDGIENPYAELPEWVRRNRLCIYKGKGEFITIDLPIELRALYGIGDMAAGHTQFPDLKSYKPVWQDVMTQMTQILPIDFMGEHPDQPLLNFVPSTVTPLAEAVMNTNWYGRKIEKDKFIDENAPRWKRAYESTNKAYMGLSKWLNSATNRYSEEDLKQLGISEENIKAADENVQGAADGWLTDPALLEHIVNGYLGGVGQTAGRLGHIFSMIGDASIGEILGSDKMPVARRLHYSPTDQNRLARTRNRWWHYKDELDAFETEMKALKSIGGVDPMKKIKQISLEDSIRATRAEQMKDAMKQYNKLNKIQKNAANDSIRANAKARMEQLMENTVRGLDALK